MEFHEKLQELRKSRGLTQEELAEALFVSRTAISKWESGRGYPSIDSLKEISSYFSVSIDDLLSGEQLIFIAEKENKSNLNGVCELLLGFVDLFSLMLIFLPVNGVKVTQNPQCPAHTTQDQWSPVFLIHLRHCTILTENYRCKHRRHQISEEALLHRRQITCQTYAHIHTSKEKRRQDDHYHTLYVIFLFHQI